MNIAVKKILLKRCPMIEFIKSIPGPVFLGIYFLLLVSIIIFFKIYSKIIDTSNNTVTKEENIDAYSLSLIKNENDNYNTGEK